MSDLIKEAPMRFVPQAYKWWEIMFGHKRFIRKVSKCFWIKLNEPGYSWVKWDKEEFENMKFSDSVSFEVEDWTSQPLPHRRKV